MQEFNLLERCLLISGQLDILEGRPCFFKRNVVTLCFSEDISSFCRVLLLERSVGIASCYIVYWILRFFTEMLYLEKPGSLTMLERRQRTLNFLGSCLIDCMDDETRWDMYYRNAAVFKLLFGRNSDLRLKRCRKIVLWTLQGLQGAGWSISQEAQSLCTHNRTKILPHSP